MLRSNYETCNSLYPFITDRSYFFFTIEINVFDWKNNTRIKNKIRHDVCNKPARLQVQCYCSSSIIYKWKMFIPYTHENIPYLQS